MHLMALLVVNIIVHLFLLRFADIFARVAPMNDVLLYGYWLQQIQAGQANFGLTQDWVYPVGALVPMYLAQLFGGQAGIVIGWVAMLIVLNSLALGVLVDWGNGSRKSFMAGWFWVLAIALLGPVAIGRIDAVACGLAVLGLVAFAKHRIQTATILFSAGAWIKIWPFAMALAAFFAESRKKIISLAAIVFSSSILISALLFGANGSVLSFITKQGNRGIQIEAPIAMPWLWSAKLQLPNAGIYFDEELLTNQVSGSLVAEVSSVITVVMFAAIAITAWLGWRGFRAGASREKLFAAISLTAVLDLIVFNKVGSPQFIAWIAVPVIAWIYFGLPKWKTAVGFALLIALSTQLVYPIFYLDLMGLGNTSLSLLTLRNFLLVAFLVWANLQLNALAKPSSLIKNSAAVQSSVPV